MKQTKFFMNMLTCLPFMLAVALCSCNKKSSPTTDPPPNGNTCIFLGVDTCKQNARTTLTINLNSVKQTIHSFGASDCWTTKYIGNWSNVSKKDQIADLLFSTDTSADGTPKGIGLSLWRFNIGAGSLEQGTASSIADEWRREECFQNADGTYNWSKQSGQQWFLQAAKQRKVSYTLGFSLSAPVHITQNGKAYNGSGGTVLNLQSGKMPDYAGFLAEVTKHFQFDHLSPINEPQWSWGTATGANQEGTQAVNSEMAELTKLTAQQLSGTNSKIVLGEAGTWEYLYGKNTDNRGDQINQFFSPASSNYIGNQANVARIISAHSYFTTCPDASMISMRQQVYNKMKQVDPQLEAWQTEFGILGDICGQYNGAPRNTGIDYGLYVARVLHHDLAVMNVSSWQWWLAVSPYNYSDALVYINDPSGVINVANCKNDGIVIDSKQLWAYGNFARFIRPGMKRVDISSDGSNDLQVMAATLMFTAYKNEADKKIVIVIVNPESKEKKLQLSLQGGSVTGNTLNQYTTDAANSLKKSVTSAADIRIPPKSVVTLTGGY